MENPADKNSFLTHRARAVADEMWRVGTELNRLHERVSQKIPGYQQTARDYVAFTTERIGRGACKLNSGFCAKDDVAVESETKTGGT